eukprot:653978_1
MHMAQSSQPLGNSGEAEALRKHLISLLKVNDNGWNVLLFQDQNVINASLCGNCKDVCRDAVELGCDHDDSDIVLFCNACLNNLISTNGNKCPINQHVDPIISPVRSSRRQILNSPIICPYSIQYKKRNKKTNIQNEVVMDTIGSDQKEGVIAPPADMNGCEWKGTLNDLLNSDHLRQCVMQYDAAFIPNLQIEKLQTENESLRQTIDEQSVIIKNLQNTNKMNVPLLQKQSMELKEALKRIGMLENEKLQMEQMQSMEQMEQISQIQQQEQTIHEQSVIINDLLCEEKDAVCEPEMKFKVGDYLDVRDRWGKWEEAIVKVHKHAKDDMPNKSPPLKKEQQKEIDNLEHLEALYVHYTPWDDKWNEWIFIQPGRTICKCRTMCDTDKSKHRIAAHN